MALPEPTPRRASSLAGALVIISIVLVVIWTVPVNLWFRYIATHRAAKFWGSEISALIRDAPVVKVNNGASVQGGTPAAVKANLEATDIDVSRSPALVHLRNALLDDHNFDWHSVDKATYEPGLCYWWLMFQDPNEGKGTTIYISDDFHWASRAEGEKAHEVALDPIMAKDLRKLFAKFWAGSSAEDGTKPQAASSAAKPAR